VIAPAIPERPAGNLTLTVSAEAQQEDKVLQGAKEKRKALEESRTKMLDKLTKQMQLCIARVQSDELDEPSREKYQDMLMVIKSQMDKLSGGS
jgi:hypothetical protein